MPHYVLDEQAKREIQQLFRAWYSQMAPREPALRRTPPRHGSGCFVDEVAEKNDSSFPWGIYYHLSCEPDSQWHLVLALGLGDCSGSGGPNNCDDMSYEPGSGWTADGPDGSYGASFSNPNASSGNPPSAPPTGSWTFVGDETHAVWVNFTCNWIAYGAVMTP